MRISVEDIHQSAHKRRFISNSDIMLDGKPAENVIIADEESGFIERYAMIDGKPVIDESGDCIKTEKVYGKVKIVEKSK